MSELPK
jgi:hypothetical protein